MDLGRAVSKPCFAGRHDARRRRYRGAKTREAGREPEQCACCQ